MGRVVYQRGLRCHFALESAFRGTARIYLALSYAVFGTELAYNRVWYEPSGSMIGMSGTELAYGGLTSDTERVYEGGTGVGFRVPCG